MCVIPFYYFITSHLQRSILNFIALTFQIISSNLMNSVKFEKGKTQCFFWVRWNTHALTCCMTPSLKLILNTGALENVNTCNEKVAFVYVLWTVPTILWRNIAYISMPAKFHYRMRQHSFVIFPEEHSLLTDPCINSCNGCLLIVLLDKTF